MGVPARTTRQTKASRKWTPIPPHLLLLAVQLLLTPLLVAINGPVSVLARLETDDSWEETEIGYPVARPSRRRRAAAAYPSDLCGVWQHNYTRLHALIRKRSAAAAAAAVGRANGSNGEGPPMRFLTYVWPDGNCGGFGDTLVGIATAFVVSLLDRRAFLIGHRCFAYAFNPAFIDWRVSPDVPMEPVVDGTATARGDNGGGGYPHRPRPCPSLPCPAPPRAEAPPADPGPWFATSWFSRSMDATPSLPPPRPGGQEVVEGEGRGVVLLDLLNQDVDDYEDFFGQWRGAANLKVQWNRGRVTRMLQGEGLKGEWKRRLEATGLRIPYAFGCILRYILRPKPEVMRLVSRLQRLLTGTHTSAIGLHLRVPDHVAWKGTDAASEERWREGQMGADAEASRILACAQAVEGFWLPPSLQVMWLFMTNSERLKSQVQQQYPSKVVVSDIPPVHSLFVVNESDRRQAFISIVAEWLLFSSCCKRYVVSSESGFSRTAVLYGMKPDRLFASYSCSPETPISLLQLGDSWSGI